MEKIRLINLYCKEKEYQHYPHYTRGGFLWLKKVFCEGTHDRYRSVESLDNLTPSKVPPHKHRFLLHYGEFSHKDEVVWTCECGVIFATMKIDFYSVLLSNDIYETRLVSYDE